MIEKADRSYLPVQLKVKELEDEGSADVAI